MDTEVAPLNTESTSAQDSTTGALQTPSPGEKQDGQPAVSSTATGDQKPTSIREALQKVKPEVVEDATNEDEQDSDSPRDPNAEAGKAEADGAGEHQDGRSQANAEADGSLNAPYTKDAAWQAVVQSVPPDKKSAVIKAIRPVFEKSQRLAVEVQQLKPKAAVADEFRQYAGDEAGFQTMRSIVRAYAVDPAASVPVLEQMLQDARERAGLVVVDADLKTRIESGELDENAATELQKTRVEAQNAKNRLKQTEQTQAQRAEQAAAMEVAESLNSWEERIRSQDPDFGNVTPDEDPQHGVSIADQVLDGIRLLQMRNPKAGKAELLQEADRIHKLARSRLSNVRGRSQRVITSESSSITARPEPKTMKEALQQVKRERGG